MTRNGLDLVRGMYSDVCSGYYHMHFRKPDESDYDTRHNHWIEGEFMFDDREFERRFFKLKHGDGPVECEIVIRRKK